MKQVFMTGATGLVGSLLLPELARSFDHVYCLVRSDSDVSNLTEFHNVTTYIGDVTQQKLGLSEDAVKVLQDNVTAVLHGAAITRFDQPWKKIYPVNVVGTKNMITFCHSLPHLEKAGFLSTAFVSGKRAGLIREEELVATEFVNTYEQSKFEAEQAIRAVGSAFPWAVYRLGLLFADEETGEIKQYTAVHKALKLLSKGVLPVYPSYSSTISFVGYRFVIDALKMLFVDSFHPETTYHVTDNSRQTLTAQELLEKAIKVFSRHDQRWKDGTFQTPLLVDKDAFDASMELARETHDSTLVIISKILETFSAHFWFDTRYDTTHLDTHSAEQLVSRPVASYLEKALEYAIINDWRT